MISSEEWMLHFSEALKSQIEKNGITQRELAERAGITEAAVSRYMSGQRVPDAETLVRLSKALGCRTDELIMFKEDSENGNEDTGKTGGGKQKL